MTMTFLVPVLVSTGVNNVIEVFCTSVTLAAIPSMVTDTPERGKNLPVITKVDPPYVFMEDLLREEITGRTIAAETLGLNAAP